MTNGHSVPLVALCERAGGQDVWIESGRGNIAPGVIPALVTMLTVVVVVVAIAAIVDVAEDESKRSTRRALIDFDMVISGTRSRD